MVGEVLGRSTSVLPPVPRASDVVLRSKAMSGPWARRGAAWCVLALVAGLAPQAHAQIAGLPSPFLSGRAETWTGAEATRHSWSTYTGVNWSPFGKLGEDGVRLRLSGGYGEYRYAARVDGVTQSIYGTAAFADLLVGYQMAFGGLTLKAFAGATFDGHLLDPFDETNKTEGTATGVKACDRELAQPVAIGLRPARPVVWDGARDLQQPRAARLSLDQYHLARPRRRRRSAMLPVATGAAAPSFATSGWPASCRCRAACPAISPPRATLTERSSTARGSEILPRTAIGPWGKHACLDPTFHKSRHCCARCSP